MRYAIGILLMWLAVFDVLPVTLLLFGCATKSASPGPASVRSNRTSAGRLDAGRVRPHGQRVGVERARPRRSGQLAPLSRSKPTTCTPRALIRRAKADSAANLPLK